MPRHIKKGDSVIVTAGNDKGTVGEVVRVIPETNRVVVKGVNIRARPNPPRRIQGRNRSPGDADSHE